jgi:hypothetical protein
LKPYKRSQNEQINFVQQNTYLDDGQELYQFQFKHGYLGWKNGEVAVVQ